MSVIIILISASVFVAIVFLIIFIWAVKSGQYDDTYSPSVRMLFDDKIKKREKEQGNKPTTLPGDKKNQDDD